MQSLNPIGERGPSYDPPYIAMCPNPAHLQYDHPSLLISSIAHKLEVAQPSARSLRHHRCSVPYEGLDQRQHNCIANMYEEWSGFEHLSKGNVTLNRTHRYWRVSARESCGRHAEYYVDKAAGLRRYDHAHYDCKSTFRRRVQSETSSDCMAS